MIHPRILRKQQLWLVILITFSIVTIFGSLGLGAASVSFDRILPILAGEGTFKESFVVFELRLPRIMITIIAGMALALSGAILQSLTRNDLADPGIIGINAGAGVGVAVFFLFFPINSNSFSYLLPVAAFIGAVITAVAIYALSFKRNSGLQPMRLILIGVGFSLALSGAMIILISSTDRVKVEFISKWLAGNIWGTDWTFVWAVLPWLLIFLPLVLYKANRLNILALNEMVAVGVGVSIEKERRILLLVAVSLAASVVSVTGSISFIGLMAPHIAKSLVGSRHQLFLPIATLLGGWLLLLADTVGRNIAGPDGIAAGIMVAFIGAPYFIYLLVKTGQPR